MGILDWLSEDGVAALAMALGLERRGSCAVGNVDGIPVRIEQVSNEEGSAYSLLLGARRELPTFEACPMNGFGRLNRLLGREIASGDGRFDEHVLLDGDELEVAATLNAGMRAHLLQMVAKRASLSDGRVRLDGVVGRDVIVRVQQLLPYLRDIRAVPVAEQVVRAAENVRQDPDAGVRLRNAAVLVQRAADATEVQETLSRALIDADPHVRLFAARHARTTGESAKPYRTAGVPGNPAAVLAELAGGPYDTALRVRAIELLAARAELAELGALIESLRDTGRAAVRRAALRALSKLKQGGLARRG